MTNQIKNLKNKCCYGNDKCPTCIGKHKFNDWNVCDYCQCHLGIDCEDFCKKDNNLKNFIEEGEKEFDRKFVVHCSDGDLLGKDDDGGKEVKRCKNFISSRQISLIKMIVEMVESEKRDQYDFGIQDPAYAEQEGFNQALDTISSKLKTLIK